MTNDSQLRAVLEAATVRVDVSGVISGSGFVVSPSMVVTCYHVVEPALLPEPRWAQISVSDSESRILHATSASVVDAERDLAWLHLDGLTKRPIARLEESIDVDDPLYAWGFPPDKPNGVPATYLTEGELGGDKPWIKFKSGQVVKGMSGAPLLNRRVGAVCGVLKRTRDASQDLGGYGIPASTLFRCFESLRKENADAVQIDSRWVDALTATQRALWAPSLARELKAVDLVVNVGQGEEDCWAVTVKSSFDEVAWPTVPVDLNTVRAEVARLFRLLRASNRLGESPKFLLLGQVLARAIFPDALQDRFDALLADDGLRVDVYLHFAEGADEDLVHLPWELVNMPERKPQRAAVTLAASQRLTLSRVLTAEPPTEQPGPKVDLAVSVMSAPDPPGTKRVAEMADRVRQVLKDSLVNEPALVADASEAGLDDHLSSTVVDVLHYVGYGRYRDSEDEIALGDQDPDKRVSYLNAEEFADCFSQGRPPTLIVLESCQGPENQVPGDLSAIAPSLLMQGARAVLVLHQSLEDADDVRMLLVGFYSRIESGTSLQRAVQEVRLDARFRRRPWLFPALHLRNPGELWLVRERQNLGAQASARWGI